MGNLSNVCHFEGCCNTPARTPQPELHTSEASLDLPVQSFASLHFQTGVQLKSLREAPCEVPDSARLETLQSLVDRSKVLTLTVLTSTALASGSTISLNAQGWASRGDGHTFFGCGAAADYAFPLAERLQQGQHFVISYDIEGEAYTVKDLAVGCGTFVKLATAWPVKDNSLVNLGDSFALFNLAPTGRLRLKLFGTTTTGDVYFFSPQEHRDAPVTLGRQATCDVQVTDSLASKIQCSLTYRGHWVLEDGNVLTGKPSTNGTWLYANEPVPLESGTLLKTSHSLFRAIIQ